MFILAGAKEEWGLRQYRPLDMQNKKLNADFISMLSSGTIKTQSK